MGTKTTLFDTTFANSCGLRQQAIKALPYLVQNLRSIEIPPSEKNLLLTGSNYTISPISALYRHMLDSGKHDLFLPITLNNVHKDNIPEILLMDEIALNFQSVAGNASAMLSKTVINLTPIIKRKVTDNMLFVTDLNKMHEMFVRGLLCMSYDNSDAWLTPQLAAFIVESYTMSITATLTRQFKLDYNESIFIKVVFGLFFAQLMSSSNDDLEYPPLLNRCRSIGSVEEISQVIRHIEDNRSERLDIQSICNIIVDKGPTRMNKINPSVLYRMLSAGENIQTTMLSLEYPPYWVFRMLRAVSGVKNSLSYYFKVTGYNRKVVEFAAELNNSRAFIDAL